MKTIKKMPTVNQWKNHNNRGRYHQTIEECTEAIKSNRKYASAYRYRADAYCKEYKIDLAIKDYTKAIEINPDYASAYNRRGYAYGLRGDYTQAIADYNKSIQLNPDKFIKASAYNHLGFTYSCLGEYHSAIKYLNIAIELNPNHATAFCNIGFAYSAIGEYDLAIQNLSIAIDLDDKKQEPYRKHNRNLQTYRNRGYAYARLGKFDIAFRDHDKDIRYSKRQKDPLKLALAHNAYGLTHALKGNHKLALEYYNIALTHQKDPGIYLNIGALYQKAGKEYEAIENYDNAILYSPNYKMDFMDRKFFHNAGNTIINARKLLTEKINGLKENTAKSSYYKGIRAVFRNDTASAETWFKDAKDAASKGVDPDLIKKIDQHLKNIKDRM